MTCELFIGNLNPEIRIRDLENCFGRYGKIVRCDIKKNYGFIEFDDKRDAEEAIHNENNRRLLGSNMTVEWAKGSVGDKGRSSRGGRDRAPPSREGRAPLRDRSPQRRSSPSRDHKHSNRNGRHEDRDRRDRSRDTDRHNRRDNSYDRSERRSGEKRSHGGPRRF